MRWETPTIRDYGTIGKHTFSGQEPPGKDTRACTKDKFGEESCPTP